MTAASRLTVVVTPDSFRGSLPADEGAAAVEAGVRTAAAAAGAAIDVRSRPVADGGEGTVYVLLATGWLARGHTVTGPTGAPVRATFVLSPVGTAPRTAAVVLASASGLTLLPGGAPDPRNASTYGTGELVAEVLDEGVERLVLGIGGSATTDGGTGLAAALGVRLLDGQDRPLPPGGADLTGLARIDTSRLDARLAGTEVVVACDVDNPRTGPAGAAAVYGPQKGASHRTSPCWTQGSPGRPSCCAATTTSTSTASSVRAAAGGVGAGALAFLGANLTPRHRPAARPRRLRHRTGRRRPGGPPVRAPSTASPSPARRRWASRGGPGRRACPSWCWPAGSTWMPPTARAWPTSGSSGLTRCSTSSRTSAGRWPGPGRCCASSRNRRSPPSPP